MVKYRPHRGRLDDAMKLERSFDSLDSMYEFIVSEWNGLELGELFTKDDLSISEDLGKDDRIDWQECRYVCTKRMRDEIYEHPQCIGMCSIEE